MRFTGFDSMRKKTAFDEKILAQHMGIHALWNAVKLLIPKEVSNENFTDYVLRKAIEIDENKYWWRPQRFFSRKQRKKYASAMQAYYFLINYGDLIEDELVSSASPDWNALISNYPGQVYYTRERFGSRVTPFNQSVPSLKIASLGIFNCDVIQRYQEAERVLAKFRDEKGERVEFRKIEIIKSRVERRTGLLRARYFPGSKVQEHFAGLHKR